jgi:hypothetical protein
MGGQIRTPDLAQPAVTAGTRRRRLVSGRGRREMHWQKILALARSINMAPFLKKSYKSHATRGRQSAFWSR